MAMQSQKKGEHHKTALIGGAIVLAVLCLIGIPACSSGSTETVATSAPEAVSQATTAETQPVTKCKIGTACQSGGISVSVNSVKKAQSAGLLTAYAGKTILILDVTIATVDADTAPYNPLYFKVKDSDGNAYDSALLAPEPALKSGDLKKGDKVTGNVAFQVNENAKGLVVSYEPTAPLDNYQTIQIDLGE
jgi:hypothetical protein